MVFEIYSSTHLPSQSPTHIPFLTTRLLTHTLTSTPPFQTTHHPLNNTTIPLCTTGWAQYCDENWRAQWVAAMLQHFLRTQSRASTTSSEGGSDSITATITPTTTTSSSSAVAAIGHGPEDRASPPLVLSASVRRSFDASVFLCSAFAILPTATATATDESQKGAGEGGGGGDQPSQSTNNHPTTSSLDLHPSPPLWHQEPHCPNDRILLRKLMLGRIVECLRDDLSVSLTGTTYQLATQPTMVPTQVPDQVTGGAQVTHPLTIVISHPHHIAILSSQCWHIILTILSYHIILSILPYHINTITSSLLSIFVC